MEYFRVLVLDDSPELIAKIANRASLDHTVAGTEWRVVLHEVHVEVELKNETAQFSDETMRRIIESCRERPNLILADYGFVAPQHVNLPPDKYFQRALTPATLVTALKSYLERRHAADTQVKTDTSANFLNYTGPLYLYTYTGASFRGIDPTPEQRAVVVRRTFAKARVSLLDISKELYQDDAFPAESKEFRAFLTAGLLVSTIERELLKCAASRQYDRLKYVRFRRSGIGVLVIVLLGAGFGAAGEWLGARIMSLVVQGYGGLALAVGALAGIAFSVVGVAIPFVFERLMSNLFTTLKGNDDRTST